jgi:membrane fusion protein, heavy metal efflux system
MSVSVASFSLTTGPIAWPPRLSAYLVQHVPGDVMAAWSWSSPRVRGFLILVVVGVIASAAFGPALLARMAPPADKADSRSASQHDEAEGEVHEGHDHNAHHDVGNEQHAGAKDEDHDHAADHAPQKAGSDGGRADADHDGHDHDGHDHSEASESPTAHDHDEHAGTAVLELTPQALKNIGYEPFTVAVGDYQRTISFPGIVVERPGKTQVYVAAPLGGVVTHVHVIQGEAVADGAPLFDVRLTHEELVSAQGEFLKATEELEVINQEIARLEALTEGVVAGSRVREQRYERQKLEAHLRAQRQALLLHGLSEADVDEIVRTRQLLQSLTIRTPAHQDDAHCADDHLYHVQRLAVQRGQQIEAGGELATLADHCELYIEGTAFEEDAERIRQTVADNVEITADLLVRDRREGSAEGLKILYIADQVERDSRALHFYATLPNSIALDRTVGQHRFLQWRFKPGQRVELRVPVERWQQRLVLPASAVVDDGAEAYVFVEEGPRHFHRTPVHVLHRDQKSVVVDNDGPLHAGDKIAGRGAFQMHLDLKNRAGGGLDPHAGHSH